MSKYTLGKNSTRDLETLAKSGDERSLLLIELVKGFIRHTPADFCILEGGGFRTPEDQKGMYDRKVSKCDGYKIKSKHQSGLAVDLVPWVNGKPTWNQRQCDYIAGSFKTYCSVNGVAVRTGADWNGDGNMSDGWDACHVELI